MYFHRRRAEAAALRRASTTFIVARPIYSSSINEGRNARLKLVARSAEVREQYFKLRETDRQFLCGAGLTLYQRVLQRGERRGYIA